MEHLHWYNKLRYVQLLRYIMLLSVESGSYNIINKGIVEIENFVNGNR